MAEERGEVMHGRHQDCRLNNGGIGAIGQER
jgi:hypothetical protein